MMMVVRADQSEEDIYGNICYGNQPSSLSINFGNWHCKTGVFAIGIITIDFDKEDIRQVMPATAKIQKGKRSACRVSKSKGKVLKELDERMASKIYPVTDLFDIVLLMPDDLLLPDPNSFDININEWFDYPALTHYYGPNSIIEVIKFNNLVKDALKSKEKVRVIVGMRNPKRTNAAFLVGAYLLLERGMESEIILLALHRISSVLPSYGTQGIEQMLDHIEVCHCIRGLETFRRLGLFDPNEIDAEETARMEDPENGDMNWIVKGKLLAFAGPDDDGLPEFVAFAKTHRIKGVVRLNQGEYEATTLEDSHIEHLDLQVVDGSIPSLDQVRDFMEFAEKIIDKGNGGLAVHCRAGLGRTGTMIGAYLIRKYKIDAKETVAFMRVMRPGMFLTRQQRFMEAIQYWLRGDQTTGEQKAFIEAALGYQIAQALQKPF